jgi:tRNA 2-thiouridine synthesizing protein E
MKQEVGDWLTTGQAAELCAVTPATVLNWIRKGRLDGVRTAGGHYRIKRATLEPLLHEFPPSEWGRTPSTPPRPLRCWEYLSDGGVVRDECQDCVVHSMRAAWCFRLAVWEPEEGHAGLLCPTSCDDCAYFRRVMNLPTNVLVVTADPELVNDLGKAQSERLSLRFAHNGYESSAAVEDFSPDFAVIDQESFPVSEGGLSQALAADRRLPGLKIILAVSNGGTRTGMGATPHAVVRVIQKPFGLSEIEEVISSLPVESIPSGESHSTDLSPMRDPTMVMAHQVTPALESDVNDDGFLKTMSTWDRAAAEALAEEHGIGPLTDEHWKVIEFVQGYYRTHKRGPPVVQVHRETGLGLTQICRLFPCGLVKGAYRLAGLPRPPGCV